MAIPTTYLVSTKNLAAILEQLQKGRVPPKLTYDHLKQLGFPSSNDRPIIPLLKALGFLDPSGTPQERYRRFKNPSEAKMVMAEGIKDAYSDVFAIDEHANRLAAEDVRGIFARLSDKGETVTEKMAKTFRALVEAADFSLPDTLREEPEEQRAEEHGENERDDPHRPTLTLRHDVHVHLPVSDDIKVYDAIFRSLRENLSV